MKNLSRYAKHESCKQQLQDYFIKHRSFMEQADDFIIYPTVSGFVSSTLDYEVIEEASFCGADAQFVNDNFEGVFYVIRFTTEKGDGRKFNYEVYG